MRIVVCLFVLASLTNAQGKSDRGSACKYGRLPVPPRAASLAVQAAPAATHTLAVYYALPSNVAFSQAVYDRLVEATLDIQGWYQCASGGLTWRLAFPEVVRVFHLAQTREYYDENDRWNWWGPLLDEMAVDGQPTWSPGTVAAIWAHGAGGWAGGAQGCGGECGAAVLGVEIFPEFNNPEWSGRTCPDGVGGAAWPCTPEGAYAHELGHTLGLPHPFDVPETQAVSVHSVMHTHWNYPNFAPSSESPWGFLTLERQRLRASPFMQAGVDLFQIHGGCDVVNLPSTGALPLAEFRLETDALALRTTNLSQGAALDYWMFGDGGVSNAAEPIHTYLAKGTYSVALRVSADDAMMDLQTQDARLASCRAASSARASVKVGPNFGDDAFTLKATLGLGFSSNGIDPLTENVRLSFGPFSTFIPRNSFRLVRKKQWEFVGSVGGADLAVVIRPQGKNVFAFSVAAGGVELAGIRNPVSVELAIGTETWCSAVEARDIR